MAYSDTWDEAAPPGTAAANTLDTIIQQLKRAMRERLEDPFPDWADDAVDPKRVVVHSGLLIDRPDVPDSNAGEVYLATDTAQVFVFDGTAWIQISNSAIWASYDDSQAPASKVTSELGVEQIVAINVNADTDGSGDIFVDFNEIDIEDVDLAESKTRIYQPVSPASGGAGAGSRFAFVTEISVGGSVLQLRCFDQANNALPLSTSVSLRIVSYQAAP